MNKQLLHINDKINAIQSGLLRCQGKGGRSSLQVRVVSGDDGILNCVVAGELGADKLMNRKVSLIQRHADDYLFVAGKVFFVGEQTSKLVSINISKAFWFKRKAKGRITWLENKYVYENEGRRIA